MCQELLEQINKCGLLSQLAAWQSPLSATKESFGREMAD
jgi:hypothetical protein